MGCYYANMDQNLQRNVSSTLWDLLYKEFRQFWRQVVQLARWDNGRYKIKHFKIFLCSTWRCSRTTNGKTGFFRDYKDDSTEKWTIQYVWYQIVILIRRRTWFTRLMCKKAFVRLTQMKPRVECNLMQASLEGTVALMVSVTVSVVFIRVNKDRPVSSVMQLKHQSAQTREVW